MGLFFTVYVILLLLLRRSMQKTPLTSLHFWVSSATLKFFWSCQSLSSLIHLWGGKRNQREREMITRHNLADQLREYQIRNKHDWASSSFFTSTSNFTSRVDIVIFVIWELVILAFLVLSGVSLYFRHVRLAFILLCVTLFLLLCMKVSKQIRLARKKKRRMLLPLSM